MAVTINGSTGLELEDNDKQIFGAGDDLQIYHTSNVNYIAAATADQHTVLKNTSASATGKIYIEPRNGESAAVFDGTTGEVSLRYGGNIKMITTSTGINITGGIRLGGNNAANECDDYEEGTWTPRLGGSNISTYNVTGVGHYTKIGRMVFCVLRFSNTDLDNSSSGTVRIDQLPFTPSAGGVSPEPYSIFGNFLTHEGVFDETRKDGFEISSGGTMVGIQQVNDGAWIAKSVSEFQNASFYMNGSFTYIA